MIDYDKEYDLLEGMIENVNFYAVNDKKSLFDDKYQTKEQSKRDSLITQLLQEYFNRFERKNTETSEDRTILKWFSIISSAVVIIVIIILSFVTVSKASALTIEAMLAVISSFITLSGSLFAIIKYIAERAFPTDDEKYITEIVKMIQENDLKHKQENIKASDPNMRTVNKRKTKNE